MVMNVENNNLESFQVIYKSITSLNFSNNLRNKKY